MLDHYKHHHFHYFPYYCCARLDFFEFIKYIDYHKIFISAQNYENFSNFIFKAIINDEKILEKMHEVNYLDASDVVKENIREELYVGLKEYYDIYLKNMILGKYNFIFPTERVFCVLIIL